MQLSIPEAIHQNIIDFISNWSHYSGITLKNNNDLIWIESKYQFSRLNRILHTNIISNPGKKLIEYLNYFKSRNTPFLFIDGPLNNPKHIENILYDQELKKLSAESGMALDLKSIKSFENNSAHFKIKKVQNKQEQIKWCEIFALSFDSSTNAVEIHLNIENAITKKSNNRINYLGYYKSVPVCCATLFSKNKTSGLYSIGTLKEFRGKGFGTLITKHLINEAINNKTELCTLHASASGQPIYKKLGFKEYCIIDRYKMDFSG